MVTGLILIFRKSALPGGAGGMSTVSIALGTPLSPAGELWEGQPRVGGGSCKWCSLRLPVLGRGRRRGRCSPGKL